MTEKLCSHCNNLLDVSNFCSNRLRPDGLSIHCKACRKIFSKKAYEKRKDTVLPRERVQYRERSGDEKERDRATKKRYYDKNKAAIQAWNENYRKANRDRVRANARRRHYAISEHDFNQLFSEQDERCSICCVQFDYSIRHLSPCVDHDHATGAVRGLLCGNCNTGLGMLGDSEENLMRAALYLEQFRNRGRSATALSATSPRV